MTEKMKKNLVIAATGTICLVLAAGIGLRFSSHAVVPSGVDPYPVKDTKEPVVDIQNTERPDNTELVIDIAVPDKTTDPGKGAINTGTVQTIQSDPVKPDAPGKPIAPGTTTLPDDHRAEDVPQEERNTEAPPSYEPEQTTITPAAQQNTQDSHDQDGTYVPGFGYVENSGANKGELLNDMYENGNKIGIMGGD